MKNILHLVNPPEEILYIYFIFKRLQILSMLKGDNRAAPMNEPICKKIQNYIFKFTDLLGQGNFSKVYKAHH